MVFALARVIFIDEAALLLEKMKYLIAPPGEYLAKVVPRYSANIATNFMPHTEDHTEEKHHPLPPVERKENAMRAGYFCLLSDYIRTRMMRPYRFLYLGRIFLEIHFSLRAGDKTFFLTFFDINDVVHDNAIHPGPESRFSGIEGRQLGDDLDEDFLGDVLSREWVKNHANGNVVYPCLMAEDKGFEG
jgi:hypothetical protein